MPSEIVRIQPDGRLDRSFGANGIALGIAGAIFSSLAVDHTGRILAAGALQGPPVLEDSESAVLERFLATNSRTGVSKRAAVRLVSLRIRADRGRATVKLACAGADACRGTLTLLTSRRTLPIASGKFRIPPGRGAVVTLRLDRRGRRLLHTHHHLTATLTILKVSPLPRSTRSQSVTIA